MSHHDLFARRIREYAADRPDRCLHILEAGCGRRGSHVLDLTGIACRVTGVDHDDPVVRAHLQGRDDLGAWTLGDLRTIPLPPRSFDVVHSSFLLERTRHAELVLDRLAAALKPGGLLLLRIRDRESAYGFLDRILPDRVRTLLWRWLGRELPGDGSHAERAAATGPEDPTREYPWPPGMIAPGPFPAVYEPIVSARGIQWYCLMRGLVIVERYPARTGVEAFGRWARLVATVCRVVSALTRGRLGSGHDELTFVIRKPENRFARVL